MPQFASIKVHIPRSIKFHVVSDLLASEFLTDAALRMDVTVTLIWSQQSTVSISSRRARKVSHLQSTHQEDGANHQLVARAQLKRHNGRNRQRQNHYIRQNVHNSIRDPEYIRVNACCIQLLIPRTRNRYTLKNRGCHSSNTPSDDDSHDGVGGDLELLGHKDAQVEQDGGHFAEANGYFVRRLCDEEPPERRLELDGGEIGFVHAISISNGNLNSSGEND